MSAQCPHYILLRFSGQVFVNKCQIPRAREGGDDLLTWRRKLEKELKELNLNYTSAERLAQDRRGWRALVAGLSPA